jgi:hypothetical protein
MTVLPTGLLVLMMIGIATLLFCVFFIWLLFGGETETKRRILAAIPDRIEFKPIKPEDFLNLDSKVLERYTSALESLGFVTALDYTGAYKTETNLSVNAGFARLLTHPAHHCFAEINQAFPINRGPTSVGCSLVSLFKENWGLSTSDRKPEPLYYAWRRPRMLWSSLPGVSPTDLLTEHLKLRQQMIQGLHLQSLTELTPESYFAHELKDLADRKLVLQSKSTWTILYEMRKFVHAPKNEWLGEFAQKNH